MHWNSSGILFRKSRRQRNFLIGILIEKIVRKVNFKTIFKYFFPMNPICFEQIFLGETFFKIKISFLTLIWRQKWCYFAWQHDKQLFFLLFPDLCRQKVESRTWYNSVKLPVWHCLPTIPHDQRPKTCPCLAWDPIQDKKR